NLYGVRSGQRLAVPVPEILRGGSDTDESEENPPPASTVIGLLLIPLVMIFANTGLSTAGEAGWIDGDAGWVQVALALGSTPVALLVTVFVAGYVLGPRRGRRQSVVERLLDSSLGPVCAIILMTGAGGMFGAVLRASGIGDALSDALSDVGLLVFVAAYVIATVLHIAQ